MKILCNIGILCWVELCIALTRSKSNAQELYPPSAAFNRHSIVRPILLHKRTKREIATTRDPSGLHHLDVTLKVPIDGEEYILDLRLNQDLVPENHVLSYQENGNTLLHKPTKEEMDLCHYGGSVRGKPGSWVAVSTCHGVQGVVFDGERMRYIEPAGGGGDVNSDHYIYDQSDLAKTHPRQCGYQGTNNTWRNSHEARKTRYRRGASGKNVLYESRQANEHSLYVELVLVVDNMHFEAHHRDRHAVHREMKVLANILNSMFSSLNIYIVLVGVVIWNDHDLIALERHSGTVLDNFNKYRTTTLLKKIRHDNAHLVTLQGFDNNVVGLAYVDTMCTFRSSCGIANYDTPVIGDLAWTIAHEMGHNFGMAHDAEGVNCECPSKKCIMGAEGSGVEGGWRRTDNSIIPSHWSSCSLNTLASSFSKGMDSCLRNKPERLLDTATCGNGIVEAGEQCDCGTLARETYNPCHACCDPHTCMPRANASCGAGRCCDLQTCRPMPAGTLCRAAARECDLPEYCGGHSALCPDDVHKMDATPCGKGGESAYCAEGQCRSHLSQCRVLWGSTAESCATFYDFNLRGDLWGDCGFDRLTQVYDKCSAANIMCGRLQCTSKANGPQVGLGDAVNAMTVKTDDRGVKCHTVSIDLGLDVLDFGLVPDGAKCGEGMMCLKRRCVSVAAIRERMSHVDSSECPSNCSGHGVCNSKGHCHCDLGFGPPLCAQPGPGGSYDSEPATDPTILTKFMVAMYAIFLGIVPAIALVLIMIYCWRQNDLQACKKYQQKPSFTPTDCISCVAGNESPTYDTTAIVEKDATAVVCRSSVIYANIEEIRTRKTENQKTIPLVLPLKNCNQAIHSGYSQVQPKVKPTPNLDNLSREIRTKLEETDKELIKSKSRPLMKPEPISNLVSEHEANAKVDNSKALKIKPLLKTSPDSHKSTGEIQINAQVVNSDGLKIKPLVKPNLHFKNLENEPQANAQFDSNDAVKIRPLMKPKPNSKNLENEPQANAQFDCNDAVKIRPLMKPKPNSKNLKNEPQANAHFDSNDAVKIRPLMKPKPNSKNLQNEPKANTQFVSNDAVKIRPLMKPKPNSKNLENEPQANAQFDCYDAVKIRPLMKPKPNSKNLKNEPQANAHFDSNDAAKIRPLMKPKPNSRNLENEHQANAQIDSNDASRIKTLMKPKPKSKNWAREDQANVQADNSEPLKIKPLVKTKPNFNH